MRHGARSIGVNVRKQRVERNAFPNGTEFRPACHAVEVHGGGLAGQLAKRFPIPFSQELVSVVNRKFPAVERHVWRRSCGQDWEVGSEVLSWRYRCTFRAASTGKPS